MKSSSNVFEMLGPKDREMIGHHSTNLVPRKPSAANKLHDRMVQSETIYAFA